MDIFQIFLVVGAIVTLAAAWRLPNAALWIGVAAANFAIGSVWQHLGLPLHTFTVMMLDAGVCILIYFLAREVWEENLYNLYRLSVLISILRLSGVVDSNMLYVIALELVNWAILALIGGTVLLNWIRANDHDRSRHSWIGRLHRLGGSLRASRQTAPFR